MGSDTTTPGTSTWSSAGWMPIRITRGGVDAVVDWCELGDTRFVDPFFNQTVDRVLTRPAASLLRHQTTASEMVAAAATEPGPAPDGFIFHASRSGSTLLAQMMAASPLNRVLSEPDPVDQVLLTGYRHPIVDTETRVAWLRSILAVMGRHRNDERRLFVKLDPWHILDFPIIRRAFPDVPWVFSCREPLEILVSQARAAGSQFVVGPLPTSLFDLDLATAAATPRGLYAAHVLDRILAAATTYLPDGGMLIDHAELPGRFDDMLEHFAVETDQMEQAIMHAAADFDAKQPHRHFVSDTESKRAEADDGIRLAADAVRPTYQRLLEVGAQHNPVPVR